MPDNFNTIEGTEVLNLNDDIQGSHAVTVDDLKEYSNIGVPGELVFEAYIKQKNGDDPQAQSSGSLVVGTTYLIQNYISGDDFTNVGALNNVLGHYFIATGTTPAVWTEGSNLEYNNGAPTIPYIIKDDIGVHRFIYNGTGDYILAFINDNFTENKTFINIGTPIAPGAENNTTAWRYNGPKQIRFFAFSNGSVADGILNVHIKMVVLP